MSRTGWSKLLGVAGLAISAYLTATHYLAGEVPLVCATGGVVNCEEVTSSAQSSIGPLPVAVLGLVWFGVWLALCVAPRGAFDGRVPLVQLAWAAAGLLAIFYLIYVELFVVGAICLWCTAVHAAGIALFLIAVADATQVEEDGVGVPVTSGRRS
jgi:uncharacterized membrane protein